MLHVLAHFIAHFALVILGGLWTMVIRTPRTIEAANGNGHGRMPYWLHIRNEEAFVRESRTLNAQWRWPTFARWREQGPKL
ncbi:hypothetical protein [Ralstonia insidiosa]|uniref:Uncharacterized protein n=1 Tax=Ralstonia insidiosa TaxID=190721 RepID=A0A192A5G7_9RALS|nr:hypothetical protein A9Y76_24160 [Ralstonia insidiosa]